MLINESTVRKVSGLSKTERDEIHAFVQGAVYSWIKNRKGEKFSARDLFGGENTNWYGTPLQLIHKKHKDAGKDDDSAFEASARDIGWIIKSVLHNDSRHFEVDTSGYGNAYRWVE